MGPWSKVRELWARVPRALARRAALWRRRAAGREQVVFFEREGGGDAGLGEGLSVRERAPGAPARDRPGSRLFVLEHAGEVRSAGWVTRSDRMLVGELGRTVQLARPAVWIWDCATPPAHRGQGYYPALLRGICAHFPGEHVVIFAHAGNEPSLRGIRKAGFAETFTATRWVLRVSVARRPGPSALRRID